MKYTYGEKGEKRPGSAGRGGSALLSVVLVCAAAAGAVMLRNVSLSTAVPALSRLEKLTDASDGCVRALSALGRAAGGEKPFSDAISEVSEYAFGGSSAVVPAADSDGEGYTFLCPALSPEEEGAVWTASELPGEEFSADEAAVAAFTEGQTKYTDQAGIPASVTFEMPAIDFNCICPVMGCVSSSFGYRVHPVDGVLRFHYGTDIAAERGTPVSVFADGRVTSAGESASYGRYVTVEHPGGAVSLYAHLNSIAVAAGDELTMGETVGTVGSTGNATGPCLHFEMRVEGQYVNPEYYVSWT